MPLINNTGEVIEDPWSYADAERIEEIRPHRVVPFEILSDLEPDEAPEGPLGVFASAGIIAEQIAPVLHKVDLVVIEFPKFRDGRGFTVARALRGRHGFQGDIRAIGHILPDQLLALRQCGFTSIVTPLEHPPEQWAQKGRPDSKNAGPLLQRLIRRPAAASAHIGEGDATTLRP